MGAKSIMKSMQTSEVISTTMNIRRQPVEGSLVAIALRVIARVIATVKHTARNTRKGSVTAIT